MNRFKRNVSAFLLALVAAVALLPAGVSVPQVEASCNIFNLGDCPDYSKVNYCNSNDPGSSKYCSIDKGTQIAKDGIRDIQKERKFSQYIQDVVAYLLLFLGILGVIYIIYAGFIVLTSSGDEEKVKKAKGTIKYVAAGLLLIFLAYSIVTFIIRAVNAPASPVTFAPSIFPTAYAEAAEDVAIAGTFQEYRKRIDELAIDLDREYKVDGKIKDSTLLRLKALIVGTMDTFSDRYATSNATLANSVITAIEVVRRDPGSDVKIGDLASTMADYFKNAKIDKVAGKVVASPATGNAPLVTSLRAEEVKDPSGVLIPSRNYVWWIKGAGGARTVIGTGPSLAYTFREERNYTVFLDVLSASRNAKGKVDVLPLQASVDVSVLPKLGNVILYVNGTNVSNLDKHKITPAAGRAGIVIDASASQATGGAAIVRTQWQFGNGAAYSYDGPPRLERQSYVEGTYRVKLTLVTNEKQTVSKEFDLQVQDPMATIRADRTEGYANEDFKFQANPNLGGTPLSYEWNILEADGGKILYTSKVATANYKFPRMGRYVVRLKTFTPSGKQDIDTLNININSKDPVALFDTKTTGQENPNTILFDATKSYDPDSLDASKLTFSWNIDGERTELSDSQRNGAIGKYTFSTLGTHKISLEVTNEQGKTSTVRKDVDISSLLSVKLSTTPKIASVGSAVNFVAESKEANVFEWNFGDGTPTEISSAGRISHVYKKSGTIDVVLTVRGANSGGQNTITRKVYVTDANAPFALIGLKRDSDTLSPTAGACNDKEAFVVDRIKPVRFTGEESVNVDGTVNGLSYSWKYGSKTSTQRDFTYKFDELGCFPVSLTVRSQKTGKTNTMQTYVKVENASPTFSSISINVEKADSDPVIVKVTANNATDEDGVITSYLWYYYTDSDPEPQDFRITRTPSTAFVLPRINGKYYFAVTMEDSNGEKVNSDQQREERYSITLASDNINTPLLSLKADKTNVNAGEKVKFDVLAKNVLGIDISEKAQYKWDFDGDGFYDESGDKPTVTHVYDRAGSMNMKVKVTYKGISNTKYQVVNVKNDLRPSAEYIAVGRRFVFLNTTPGVYQTAKWTVGNGLATSENKDSFSYEFAEGDDLSSTSVRLDVGDGKDSKYVEIPLRKDSVNEAKLKKTEDKLVYFSYPRASADTIEVSNPEDSVFFYLAESKDSPTKFAIDSDIELDSDLNGEAADDVDNKGTDSYSKGSPFAIKDLKNGHRNRTVRLTTYDASGKQIATKDVKIVLTYLEESSTGSGSEAEMPKDISDTDKANIEKLKDLIRTKTPEQDRLKLMQYLSNLQENWFDQREKTRVILDFEASISGLSMMQGTKDEMFALLEGFLVADSETKDEIALAVKVLKSLIPESNAHYKEIVGEEGKPGLVDEILSHPTNVTLNREIGKKILGYVKDDENVENKDKLIIKSQLEVIIYGGQANVPANKEAETSDSGTSDGIVGFVLGFGKAMGILLLVVIGLFAALFAFFKVSNRNPSLGFQDFLIEKLFGGSPAKPEAPKAPAPAPKAPEPPKAAPADPLAAAAPVSDPLATAVPVSPVAETPAPAGIPDWLKPVTDSPKASESSSEGTVSESGTSATEPSATDVSSVETVESAPVETVATASETVAEPSFASEEAALPAWLKGSSLDVSAAPKDETAEEPSVSPVEESAPVSESLPAFDLSSATEPSVTESEAAPAQESVSELREESAPLTEEAVPASESAPSATADDLPDWLKGIDSSELSREVSEELGTASASSVEESASAPEESAPVSEPSASAVSDDLPDWLKSSVASPVSESAPVPEPAPSEEEKPKRRPAAKKPKDESPAPAMPTAPAPDDLPDWLKP